MCIYNVRCYIVSEEKVYVGKFGEVQVDNDDIFILIISYD